MASTQGVLRRFGMTRRQGAQSERERRHLKPEAPFGRDGSSGASSISDDMGCLPPGLAGMPATFLTGLLPLMGLPRSPVASSAACALPLWCAVAAPFVGLLAVRGWASVT